METFNAETVGTMLKNGGLTARVYVTGDKNAFIEAFQTNIRTVAEQAGVSGGFTYGYANLGREYILTIVSSGYIVSGTATSFNSDTDEVMIQLTESGASEAAYEAVVKGNTASYSIANVLPGTYTMKVMKQNHVTREYTVTVGNSNVTQDVKIHLLGDINGDGKLNIADVGKANAHVKKTSTLTDYEFACSDINGDGKINIADVGKMNAHVKKTSLLW